ncbi:MAG TPA: ABC transporter substrate-binding protein [Xanthobacteraceae bacterium]|nr:ABC transporter substrate-binding protein [Xanthobacteraceae bacterium]
MSRTPSTMPSRRRVLAGGAAAASCLGAPALVRAQPTSLNIAVLLPRSGYLAPAGQSCHRGALVAPKVLAEFGYRVQLVHVDIESNPDVARTQCERVINEGAQCIVGAFDSASTLAMAQVCEQRKVPLVVNIAAAPQLTEQGYQFLVRNFPTAGMLVTNGLKLINDLLAATKVDPKTAVFLHANDTFGMAQRQAMDKLFPTANLPFRLLESIAYDPKAQDLSVEVTKLRALNPDLVLVVTRAADAIKLVRDMVRQHFEPMGIISPGSPGLYDEEFYSALGPLADYPIFNIPWANPQARMLRALEAAYKPANPNFRFAVESFNVGFTFEALLVAADGFKRAGTADGPALMQAIRATELAEHIMIGPPIRFDTKGQNVGIPSAAIQNRGRAPAVVLPAALATMAPVLPMPGWQKRS